MANVDLNRVRARNAKQEETGLAFVLRDYWELINWTGRIVRKGKHHLSLIGYLLVQRLILSIANGGAYRVY